MPNKKPKKPPRHDKMTLSVNNCWITRQRLAPTAVRMANSFCRTEARANKRFATFAHAISRTRPTAPNKIKSAGFTLRTRESRMGETETLSVLSIHLGLARRKRSPASRISERACSNVTPGFKRASGVKIVSLIRAVRISLKRNPKIGRRFGLKTTWNDADDGVYIAIEHYGARKNLRITTEIISPNPLAEDRHFGSVWSIFGRGKRPADHSCAAEHFEIVRRNVNAFDLNRPVAGAKIHSGPLLVIERHESEDIVLSPDHVFGD